MLVLAVDTAGQTGGVLLARNESVWLQLSETNILGMCALVSRKFSVQLTSAIAELLRLNDVTLADLDAIACVSGPGPFTGLRVGLSVVKAIAEVGGQPIISLSRLAIMASAAEARGFELPAGGLVHAVLDAGRGEFYHGIYRDAGRVCVAESLQSLTSLSDSFKSAPGLVVASEQAVVDALSGVDAHPTVIPEMAASEALPLIFAVWQTRRFTDAALLDANYLRRVNAMAVPKLSLAWESAKSRADGP